MNTIPEALGYKKYTNTSFLNLSMENFKLKTHLWNKSVWRLKAREDLLPNPDSQALMSVSCGRAEVTCSKTVARPCVLGEGWWWLVWDCCEGMFTTGGAFDSRQNLGSLFMFLFGYLGVSTPSIRSWHMAWLSIWNRTEKGSIVLWGQCCVAKY